VIWPSRVLRALLARLLGAPLQDHLGDLDEEFHDRILPCRSRPGAEAWYLREALSLLWGVVRDPLVPPFSAASGPTGTRMINGLAQDLRSAFRGLVREPGVTAVIGLTLTLTAGSTIAMFAVADAAFLRPLPYPEEEQLVRFFGGFEGGANVIDALSPLDVRGIEASTDLVEEVGVWTLGETAHMTGLETPVRVEAPRASAGLFSLLGLPPQLGRYFTREEQELGRDDAVVLSDALWRDAFGADPEVLNRTVELDGRSYRVVGVAPAVGMLPREAELWRALALGPEWYDEARWGWQFLATVARMAPNVDFDRAETELSRRLVEETNGARTDQSRIIRPLRGEIVGDTSAAILMLSVAVSLILAMACLNVMNLLLARSEGRIREYGLRRALGSGTLELGRLVAVETLAFAGVGALGGLALAAIALEVMERLNVEALASLGALTINPRVAGFAVLMTLGVAAIFGFVPLVRAIRADPQVALGTGSTKVAGNRHSQRLRGGLVSAQIALSLVLLVVVGLSIATYRSIIEHDPGFDPENALATTVELPADVRGAQASVLYRELWERLNAIPGVTSASGVNFLPLDGIGWSASFEPVTPDPALRDPDPGGHIRLVLPSYFETMEIPLVAGRFFTAADGPDGGEVVIIDEALEAQMWPGTDALGQQIQFGSTTATIVGVVGDVPATRLDRQESGHLYFPMLQRWDRAFSVVTRTTSDPLSIAGRVRDVVRAVDPRMPVTRVTTLEAHVGASMSGPRLSLLLLGIFGSVAVVLAAVGVYGVLSYTVARRTREIGTRIALGASPDSVRRSVLGRAGGALLGSGNAGRRARYAGRRATATGRGHGAGRHKPDRLGRCAAGAGGDHRCRGARTRAARHGDRSHGGPQGGLAGQPPGVCSTSSTSKTRTASPGMPPWLPRHP